MGKQSFKSYVEQELGKLPSFLIYAVLEWVLIIILFIDGFLAFAANEFSKFFELKIPCLFCTRIDHVLVHRNPNFYYNESICETHKKDVSSLAYCHAHKKLSDIRKMCEPCLLSFATGKESGDCDTYKSLVGILRKDVELIVDDDEMQLTLPANKKDEMVHVEKSSVRCCSCCGEPLKVKTYSKGKSYGLASQAPAPSPRASFMSDTDDFNEDKTPNFVRGNKFFGIPLSDSAQASPRWSTRILRKSPLEKTEDAEGNVTNEAYGDSIFHHLNRQVRLDRKSLMDLYMELDEERNAAAVAANNAMAMITRLQAEKAAVQMDALQYQRMMEEQAEYDQEALQATKDLLAKRDEEVKDLEAEIEAYREKYGILGEEGETDEDYQEFTSTSCSSNNEKSERGSSPPDGLVKVSSECTSSPPVNTNDQAGSLQDENEANTDEKLLEIKQKGHLKNTEKKVHFATDDVISSSQPS